MKEIETTRKVKHTLTDQDTLTYAKEAAKLQVESDSFLDDFDRVKAEWKAKIATHSSKIHKLQIAIDDGFEERDTACLIIGDFPTKSVITMVNEGPRKGEEIDKRAMTEYELQMEIGEAPDGSNQMELGEEVDPTEEVEEPAEEEETSDEEDSDETDQAGA